MSAPMRKEPALTIGGIGTAVAAVLTLVVSFGLNLTDDQQKAILAAVATVGPIGWAIWTRFKVSPTGGEHRAE